MNDLTEEVTYARLTSESARLLTERLTRNGFVWMKIDNHDGTYRVIVF